MVQRQEEEKEEEIQAKPLAEQITLLIQRQPEEEEEEPIQTKLLSDQLTAFVQRQVEDEEEEEPVQAKLITPDNAKIQRQKEPEEDEESIQTKRISGHSSEVTPGIASNIGALRGSGGQPLPKAVRDFFEPRFRCDFSQVRVHNNASAINTAQMLNSRAYTIRSDIMFGTGQYAPGTKAGDTLLAHELAHVIQQDRGAKGSKTQLKCSSRSPMNISPLRIQDQCTYIQRIPKNPSNVPFDGEIIPWSAALRSSPMKRKDKPFVNIIADLPKGHRLRVLGGRAWIFVKTQINNQDRVGYVSHELIKKVTDSGKYSFTTDKGKPISVGGSDGVPPLLYEKKWMKDHGLAGKVRRIPNSATSNYNCHGFVYLNARAWLNDPSPIIRDNDYFVPLKPNVDDAVVYTKTKPKLDKSRRPSFTKIPPHSGLVTKGSPGSPTEVTSKWGSWHLYQHKPADVWTEYGKPTFLRSKRTSGHTVKIK